MRPSYGNCITELVTEMPRSFSSAIQSEVAWREVLRDLTEPAIWIAPPNSSSFSVSVVLPASGWEMMAKVRRRAASLETSGMAIPAAVAPGECGKPEIIRVRWWKRLGPRIARMNADWKASVWKRLQPRTDPPVSRAVVDACVRAEAPTPLATGVCYPDPRTSA